MCQAQPGVGCLDLRYRGEPRARVNPHAEREELIRDLDRKYAS